jgi:dTDP-4-dehydrorhamnose 3,5-epimerase
MAPHPMTSNQTSTAIGHLQRLATAIPGVFEIRPRIMRDSRGFLLETYHRAKYAELGIADIFVQDNHSQSVKNTLRGLHYQLHHAQAKLCRVVEGEALDVAVDIRTGSPTFGKWTSVLLSAREQNQIYIPTGFAHGFVALSEPVQFVYKCSDFYGADDEYGIVWNDPELGIQWGVANPVISSKDAALPRLARVPPELLPKYAPR